MNKITEKDREIMRLKIGSILYMLSAICVFYLAGYNMFINESNSANLISLVFICVGIFGIHFSINSWLDVASLKK